VNAQKQPDKESDWQKTPFVNLLRYKPSQVYFARLKIKGKLIRRSLKTNQITAPNCVWRIWKKSNGRKSIARERWPMAK